MIVVVVPIIMITYDVGVTHYLVQSRHSDTLSICIG
jgi:hypothetical protein